MVRLLIAGMPLRTLFAYFSSNVGRNSFESNTSHIKYAFVSNRHCILKLRLPFTLSGVFRQFSVCNFVNTHRKPTTYNNISMKSLCNYLNDGEKFVIFFRKRMRASQLKVTLSLLGVNAAVSFNFHHW